MLLWQYTIVNVTVTSIDVIRCEPIQKARTSLPRIRTPASNPSEEGTKVNKKGPCLTSSLVFALFTDIPVDTHAVSIALTSCKEDVKVQSLDFNDAKIVSSY